MNVKSLRKNYAALTALERNSLFISAVMRKDKSEENAILAASPKTLWEKADFLNLYANVLSLSMVVMIHKADAWTNWQLFSEMDGEHADELSRLALYYYFVYTDAWAAVCEQLKINAEAMKEKMFPDCFLLWRLAIVDDAFRDLAFTEAEARAFINRQVEGEFQMTVENKTAEFRKFLELPKK